jgi:hypothetical protein
MAFKYDEAVPWGRSFNEYRQMFHLTNGDLHRSTLGCADGPANFNVEMLRKGHRVISCDPLYQCTAEQVKQRIDATYAEVIGQTRQNQEKFVWDLIMSPDELGRLRLEAVGDFLGDYDQGKRDGRCLPAPLPDLPFAPVSFDLVLCSHLLFFYSDHLSLAFHQQAVAELCQVAREVRIFPMRTYKAEPSPLVSHIIIHLHNACRPVSIEGVPYQFQRGGNMMMKIASGNGR